MIMIMIKMWIVILLFFSFYQHHHHVYGKCFKVRTNKLIACTGNLDSIEEFTGQIKLLSLQNFINESLLNNKLLLHESAIAGGRFVDELKIARSTIKHIDDEYFATLTGINKLSALSFNDVQGNATLTKNTFHNIHESIKKLTLKTTMSITKDAFDEMKSLNVLIIKNAPLKDYPSNLEYLLKNSLTTLILENTHVQRLPWSAVRDWSNKVDAKQISLLNSPLHCDSSLIDIWQIMQDKDKESKYKNFVCHSPAFFRNRHLESLTREELLTVNEPIPSIHDSNNTDNNEEQLENSNSTLKKNSELRELQGATFTWIIVIIILVILGIIILIFIIIICKRFAKPKSKCDYTSHTAVIQNDRGTDSQQALLKQPSMPV